MSELSIPPSFGADVDAWGIQLEWLDADGHRHQVDNATVRRLRELIGESPPDLEERAPIVIRPGRRLSLGEVEVTLEDGTTRTTGDVLSADFPFGYHTVHAAGGVDRSLIVSPGRCCVPQRRSWGVTIQLYAARSRDSWGIGDLGDLRRLREWVAGLGGGFVLVNPLHAVAPVLSQEDSPYLPATRRFRNPIYLRVQDVPGFTEIDLGPLEHEAAALASSPLIERDRVWALKSRWPWKIWSGRSVDPTSQAPPSGRTGASRCECLSRSWSSETPRYGCGVWPIVCTHRRSGRETRRTAAREPASPGY